jgi:hypothetical protein
MFPERERSCYIMFHENSDIGTMCKKPYGYMESQPLPGLITVKNFTDGGYDIDNCKLLVCVKSIGARKKCEESLFVFTLVQLTLTFKISHEQERNDF